MWIKWKLSWYWKCSSSFLDIGRCFSNGRRTCYISCCYMCCVSSWPVDFPGASLPRLWAGVVDSCNYRLHPYLGVWCLSHQIGCDACPSCPRAIWSIVRSHTCLAANLPLSGSYTCHTKWCPHGRWCWGHINVHRSSCTTVLWLHHILETASEGLSPGSWVHILLPSLPCPPHACWPWWRQRQDTGGYWCRHIYRFVPAVCVCVCVCVFCVILYKI